MGLLPPGLGTAESTFDDCTQQAVRKAHAAGIVKGTSPTTFSPDGELTREQLAAMLHRAWVYLGQEHGVTVPQRQAGFPGFTDRQAVSSWAEQTLDVLTTAGIMKGTSETALTPQGTCTVEQAVLLAVRVYSEVK